MKRIEQPNSWSCLAAVACMVTGEKIRALHNHVGHDGSDLEHGSPFHDRRRGFRLLEISSYLASRGYLLGGVALRENCPEGILQCDQVRFEYPVRTPAVLIVEGYRYNHAVLWTGHEVIDPAPFISEKRAISDYTLLQWWPLARVEG